MRISGRSPRTDQAIRDEIVQRLKKEDALSSSNVEVIVEDAVVTLRGLVDDASGQMLAEHVAFEVPGVNDVVNKLAMKPDWADERGAMDSEFGTEDAADASTSNRFDA